MQLDFGQSDRIWKQCRIAIFPVKSWNDLRQKGYEILTMRHHCELSIVTTLYRSAPYLREFHERICRVAEKVSSRFEIIYVNDGSPDESLDIALEFFNKYSNVRVIDLARNFGHHKAIMTGLSHIQGTHAFLIDCDLEEEPELLQQFVNEMELKRADVVYGIQKTRKGRSFERWSGEIFYYFFNLISSVPIPRNALTVRLMSRRYVKSLIRHTEREVFLLGLWQITGFTQIPIIVKKHSRGVTTYNFSRKMALLVNAITSFSNQPLIFIFYLGLCLSSISMFGIIYLLTQRLFFGVYLQGWPSMIVSIWFLCGIIIFCQGILGIYISKIFIETKQRPYTIIRKFYSKMGNNNELQKH